MKWIAGKLAKFFGFFFALGLVALLIVSVSQLFGFGIGEGPHHDLYPTLDFGGGKDGATKTVPGTYWEYVKQTGLFTLIAGAIGFAAFLVSDLGDDW